MALKNRGQNLTTSDTAILSLYAYNSNSPANFNSITKVEIYYLDPTFICEENKDGRTLVATITPDEITNPSIGVYSFELPLSYPTFIIGKYLDVWTSEIGSDSVSITNTNNFVIHPDLWHVADFPSTVGFSFSFHPNKIRKGSIVYLNIDVQANIPRTSDLRRFYENLIVVSPLQINISQRCGECIPQEEDLRIIVENASVEIRDKCVGYYLLDTTEMEKGIYDVWFQLNYGETVNISEKMQLQIF